MSAGTITIRVPDEEKKLISDYALASGMTVSELVRKSVMERIENDIDVIDLLEAIKQDDGVRHDMDEVMGVVRAGRC